MNHQNEEYQGGYYDKPAGNDTVAGQRIVPAQPQVNRLKYAVDIVFCIDGTQSMARGGFGGKKRIIDMVKENAVNFYSDVMAAMSAKKKSVAQLRVRVVLFRDFMADGAAAIADTDFFQLPEQSAGFETIIRSIEARGGGDLPEDALEALAMAMDSNWTQKGNKQRQVIVVWTDAGAHPLGYGKSSPYYPANMPSNMVELTDRWAAMSEKSKRLVIFAPDEKPWGTLADNWDNVVFVPSVAGNGLAEQQYSEILDIIANTI